MERREALKKELPFFCRGEATNTVGFGLVSRGIVCLLCSRIIEFLFVLARIWRVVEAELAHQDLDGALFFFD